ncbi:hypothetical protein SAMN02745248_02382 [Hathewaya proteolytica DSM 3090]|uniref:Uncharacterized protein n=1 Tax=Hathewaya proteolytica DSM 3090 TaxID=1121331 RepID=A0A1M6RVE5_9CLOT|nr:hypothetical protein [Hathewaya proteolytica]SHK36394.1 hypothetical protein SAMN02745248_02382 [Hathewaya proteolytica DSM 3090]
MKKFFTYIKCIIKYSILLILLISLYNNTIIVLRNKEKIRNCKQCDAIIVDFGTVPSFFGSKHVEFVMVDYYDNGRWYRTGEKNMDEHPDTPNTYGFNGYEWWMKKGDKIKIWVDKNCQYNLYYTNFKGMVIRTIVTVGYIIFIVVNIIVKRKRKRKLCNF